MDTSETLPVIAQVQMSLFERFVDITDSVWWVFETHPSINAVISAMVILAVWTVFRYNYQVLQDADFFTNNIEVAGRFSRPTYDNWRNAAMAIPPLGVCVLIFCVVTRFRAEPFLAVFGIRGTSDVKQTIISRARRSSKN